MVNNTMKPDLTPIHPDLRDAWKKFPKLSYNRFTIWIMNTLIKVMPAQKISNDIEISTLYAPVEGSKRRVMLRVYKAKAMTEAQPVLLWIHGGGLVIGNAAMEDAYLAKFVEETGIVAVSVEYRLAPAHPFPAAIDDCYTALTWIHHHASRLNIDPDRIAIGGESAGGGLAASLAQLAHDRDGVKPIFQLLVYPMLDDRSALRSDLPHQDLMTWTRKSNRFGWESYLKRAVASDNLPPYAVPARREDLSGLPTAWIGAGTLDLFYEEDKAYADRLKACGVDCEFVSVEGAFHGFDVFGETSVPVQDFRNAQVAALKKYLLAN